ncbi:MAG: universal stress protein [Nitrospirae bacterium]|nr:universal stress protein [Nitrospirota bacterium]
MWRNICVPHDQSDHSMAAAHMAVRIAKGTGATVVGSHVYAAALHDVRFRQMEYTLPEEFLNEKEMERQRKLHDTLITMGLRLISDSYLDQVKLLCEKESVPYSGKIIDGLHWRSLVKDIRESQYDLVVMGTLGMGATKDSMIGSVCERVARRTQADLLLVRETEGGGVIPDNESFRRPGSEATREGAHANGHGRRILVGIDGSPHSFAALLTAFKLAEVFNKEVEAVAVYDPYLHYVLFHMISKVLSEEGAKVFRFKEQEKLHEEIIDTGLGRIYQTHLQVAKEVAQEKGVTLKTTLLDGKAYPKILKYAKESNPWLLVLGKVGYHGGEDLDIGNNTENLLRMAPCNVFVSTQKYLPPLDLRTKQYLTWSPEAEKRLERVPEMRRNLIRMVVARYAFEMGHTVITDSVINKAMGQMFPEQAARMLADAAVKMVYQAVATGKVSLQVCANCGYVSKMESPVQCPVCSAKEFGPLDKEALEALALGQGEPQVEETFDGARMRWSYEAWNTLAKAPQGYTKRRLRARIEKNARIRELSIIPKEFVEEMFREEGFGDLLGGYQCKWTDDAFEAIKAYPEGFLRKRIKEAVESHAEKTGIKHVTFEVVKAALDNIADDLKRVERRLPGLSTGETSGIGELPRRSEDPGTENPE